MLKIDTHQHFWHYNAAAYPWMADALLAPLRRDFLPQDLQPLLAAEGVAATIAVQARGSEEETAYLLDVAAQTPWMAGVVGWLDLGAPDFEKQLEKWLPHSIHHGGKLVGLRHQIQDEAEGAAWLLRPEVQMGLRHLQKQKLVYEVLLLQPQLQQVPAGVLQACNGHTLVLDHAGKPAIHAMGQRPDVFQAWRRALAPLHDMEHVYVKLSGLVTETDWQRGLLLDAWQWVFRCMDVVLETVGPQRLLWGSDWPVCTLAAPYKKVHELVMDWASTRLSADEQAKLWTGNALRCYGVQADSLGQEGPAA